METKDKWEVLRCLPFYICYMIFVLVSFAIAIPIVLVQTIVGWFTPKKNG